MDMIKSIIKAFFLFAILIGFAAFGAKCEYDNSPVVNGKRVGAGYECHDNVLYVVSGSGMGRSIAPSFNAETGKIIKCSTVTSSQENKGGER